MFEVSYQLTTEDMEQPFGHVHHSHCLRFLERARLDFLKAIGYSFERFVDQNILLVISKIEINYLRELMEAELRIVCDNYRCEDKSIIIEQTAYNHREKLAVKAVVESKCMCLKTRRAVVPPAEFVQAFHV